MNRDNGQLEARIQYFLPLIREKFAETSYLDEALPDVVMDSIISLVENSGETVDYYVGIVLGLSIASEYSLETIERQCEKLSKDFYQGFQLGKNVYSWELHNFQAEVIESFDEDPKEIILDCMKEDENPTRMAKAYLIERDFADVTEVVAFLDGEVLYVLQNYVAAAHNIKSARDAHKLKNWISLNCVDEGIIIKHSMERFNGIDWYEEISSKFDDLDNIPYAN